MTATELATEVPQYEKETLLTQEELDKIRRGLKDTNPGLVVDGLLDMSIREELKEVIKKDYHMITKNRPEVIDYAIREIVGVGIIEEIIEHNDSLTDIRYNSNGHLILKSNDSKDIYTGPYEITSEYIERLAERLASANEKSFTPKNADTAILNGDFGHVRVNAVHGNNEVNGNPTMALRITRPTLPLNESNFTTFAPEYVLRLLEKFITMGANITLSGETGAGKSSAQKLLMSYIPFSDTLALIEKNPELHLTEMFPEKDILSWKTSENVSVIDLITKAGMRNDIDWIAVAEVLDTEVYALVQAMMTGHKILTTLHAPNARAVPKKMAHMSKAGYDIDVETLVEDIREYLDLDLHLKSVEYNGKIYRYLSEVVEYDPKGDTTIFKQRFIKGEGLFVSETGTVSEKVKERFEEEDFLFEFPENYKQQRPIEPAGLITKIPIKK